MTSEARHTKGTRILGFDIPFLVAEWKDMFSPTTVVSDIWAGCTVALVALPLNLALAIAAGVEPGVGITTGIIASIIASLFGGQRYAITGPAAAMAVVLIEIAQAYGLAAIWLVGLMAGAMQMAAGMLRLGKIISFIPMPVVTGFANAIGVLVIFNALDDVCGLTRQPATADKAANVTHQLIPEFVKDIADLVNRVFINHEFNVGALAIGALVLALAVFVPKWVKVVPGQLVAIVVASLVAFYLHLEVPRIVDISHIPTNLPMPSIPQLPWSDFAALFASAITVFMLGSIESLLSASVADGMTMSRRHHSDQELIGQGLANVIVPFFGGIPVTGVIARTAVNIRSGAKTRLSGLIHSAVLLILTMVFATYAEQIPLAALGGVLILTGIRLIEWDASRQIWKASRREGLVLLVTTVISVLVDLTAGVFTGLLLTCGLFIRQMSAVRIESPDDDRRAHVRQPVPSCKFVRTFLIDGPLFFGAAERFTETILFTQNLKAIVLHMRAVDVMDLTGAETVLSIHSQLQRNGVRLVIAEVPKQPFELFKRVGALETIGQENFFKDYSEALMNVNQTLLETSCSACSSCLKSEKAEVGPKDCALQNALILNTNQIATRMKTRMFETTSQGETLTAIDESRLVAVDTPDDIPKSLEGTPIADLLRSQNFLQVEAPEFENPRLVIGMCTDYRKQLHFPNGCAFVIRETGANMKDSQFSIALALSQGVKHMALIVDSKCILSNPAELRATFVRAMSEEHGWYSYEAASFFDNHAGGRDLYDSIDFAIHESNRLMDVFQGLKVVPLMFNVDDEKLYIIKDWLEESEQKPEAVMVEP